ncbi:MAG: Wzz/FepE/Etk N-terminal domain-containing protein [Bilophila sp.]
MMKKWQSTCGNYIFALKKRALIILAACLLGGVVAGVYTKLCITPMYTATSSMLVTTQETTLTSIANLQLGKRSYGRLQYSCDKPAAFFSKGVEIEDLGLNMNHHQLRGSITITNPEGTHIMEATARSSDPTMQKRLRTLWRLFQRSI